MAFVVTSRHIDIVVLSQGRCVEIIFSDICVFEYQFFAGDRVGHGLPAFSRQKPVGVVQIHCAVNGSHVICQRSYTVCCKIFIAGPVRGGRSQRCG